MSEVKTTIGRGFMTTPGCLICGGETGFYGYTRTYQVPNRQSGQNICNMFNNIGARLDCWDSKDQLSSIIVGSCYQHEVYLDILDRLVIQKKTITQQIVDQVKNFSVDKFKITQKTGIKATSWDTKDLTNNWYLTTQNSCFICNNSVSIAFGLRIQSEKPIFELFKTNNILSENNSGSQINSYILSCSKHKHDLEHLSHVIQACGNIINSEIIAKVIHDSKFNRIQRRINCSECNTFSY